MKNETEKKLTSALELLVGLRGANEEGIKIPEQEWTEAFKSARNLLDELAESSKTPDNE